MTAILTNLDSLSAFAPAAVLALTSIVVLVVHLTVRGRRAPIVAALVGTILSLAFLLRERRRSSRRSSKEWWRMTGLLGSSK
ncbi:MAG: hypothetical protein IPK07_04230 [Deltaproteobacteria bacterium]|nr:hypothetical protein [Deltaproteobacteria bacterium]